MFHREEERHTQRAQVFMRVFWNVGTCGCVAGARLWPTHLLSLLKPGVIFALCAVTFSIPAPRTGPLTRHLCLLCLQLRPSLCHKSKRNGACQPVSFTVLLLRCGSPPRSLTLAVVVLMLSRSCSLTHSFSHPLSLTLSLAVSFSVLLDLSFCQSYAFSPSLSLSMSLHMSFLSFHCLLRPSLPPSLSLSLCPSLLCQPGGSVSKWLADELRRAEAQSPQTAPPCPA